MVYYGSVPSSILGLFLKMNNLGWRCLLHTVKWSHYSYQKLIKAGSTVYMVSGDEGFNWLTEPISVEQIHKCNLSLICLCNQLRVSPVCCLIELILNYSLNKICSVSWTPSRRRKSDREEKKKKKKLFWWLMHSNRKRYKSNTPPCHPKTALLTHFFISSIDLRVMTLSLCLYLSSAVSALPLQTVYRLHLCFHYTALFSIAELKLRLAVRHHSPLLPEQPESVNRLLRLILGSAAC